MGALLFDEWAAQDDMLRQAKTDPAGQAMNDLLRRYEPLARRIARSMTSCPMLRDDLENEARIAFTKAVQRHRLGRPGFGAYAKQYMWGAARRYLSLGLRQACEQLSDVHDAVSPPPPEMGWGSDDVASAVLQLPMAQQQLLTQRYVLDASLASLAATSSTSESAVSQRLRTAERAVRRLLAA